MASCLDSHLILYKQLALTLMNVPFRAILRVRRTLIALTQKDPTNVFLKKVPGVEMTVAKTRDSWTLSNLFFGYDPVGIMIHRFCFLIPNKAMFDWQNLSAIGCKTVIQSLKPDAVIHYKLVLDDFDRYDYVNVASCDHDNGFIIALRSDKNIGPTGYPLRLGPVAGNVDDQWTIVIGGGRGYRNFVLAPGKTGGRLGTVQEPNR